MPITVTVIPVPATDEATEADCALNYHLVSSNRQAAFGADSCTMLVSDFPSWVGHQAFGRRHGLARRVKVLRSDGSWLLRCRFDKRVLPKV